MGIFRKALLASAPAIAALGALMAPTAASAATVVYPCDPALVSPNATACSGYYEGNLLGGSAKKRAGQATGVAALGATYTFDGDWDTVEDTKIEALVNGNLLDFGTMLYGQTIIAAHFGNVAGPAGNVTAFWLFDFGTAGASSVALNNTQGFSNAVLYTTGAGAVPEPSVWMLLILAFGAIGYAMRASKGARGRVACA